MVDTDLSIVCWFCVFRVHIGGHVSLNPPNNTAQTYRSSFRSEFIQICKLPTLAPQLADRLCPELYLSVILCSTVSRKVTGCQYWRCLPHVLCERHTLFSHFPYFQLHTNDVNDYNKKWLTSLPPHKLKKNNNIGITHEGRHFERMLVKSILLNRHILDFLLFLVTGKWCCWG